jgi:hypothetical protein
MPHFEEGYRISVFWIQRPLEGTHPITADPMIGIFEKNTLVAGVGGA